MSAKRKVLHVVHQFAPKSMGGTEIYTYNLCRELQKRFAIRLFFTKIDRRKKQYSVAKGVYHGLPFTVVINNHYWGRFVETYRDSAMNDIFTRELEEFEPEIIHIQHLRFLSTDIVQIAKTRNIPVIVSLHDFWLMCPKWGIRRRDNAVCSDIDENLCAICLTGTPIIRSMLDRAVFRMIDFVSSGGIPNELESPVKRNRGMLKKLIGRGYNVVNYVTKRATCKGLPRQIKDRLLAIKEVCSRVDLFVAPSMFLKAEYVRCLGIPENKIIYSPNGLSITGTRPAQARELNRLAFGYVGQLAAHKGVHILIEAFNNIDAADVELNIFGGLDDPFEEDYILSLKKLAKNKNIRFRGRFDPSDISSIYSEMEILVVPSICFETFSLVIHEAFSFGIPVVAADIGAMAEVVTHKGNGLLFRAGNPGDLYEKIKMLVDDRRLIGELARAIKPVKTIDEDAVEFERRYLRLLNQASY